MKRILLKVIAVFEMVCGLLGGITGKLSYEVVLVLWFGVFPLVSFVSGVLLLLNRKHAITLSILVQLLQVPVLYTDGLWLNLGLPLQLNANGVWNARDGGTPTLLGANLLALVVLLALLWCRSALRDVPPAGAPSDKLLQPTP